MYIKLKAIFQILDFLPLPLTLSPAFLSVLVPVVLYEQNDTSIILLIACPARYLHVPKGMLSPVKQLPHQRKDGK